MLYNPLPPYLRKIYHVLMFRKNPEELMDEMYIQYTDAELAFLEIGISKPDGNYKTLVFPVASVKPLK